MNRGCILLVLLVILTRAAPGQPDSPPAQRSAKPIQSRLDLVHLGDLIDVDVVGSFEFDWRGTLTPEGFLDGLERLEEPVYALCRSESELSTELEKAFSRILRNPEVVVRIVDRSNRAVVFLDGAVKFPQRFQIRRPVRLNELLVVAGGITENASGEISIFRPQNLNCEKPRDGKADNGRRTLNIKIADLLGGGREYNPQILSGDIITVAESLPVYVMGGVNVPKQISARLRTTLSRAVAAAGGVSKRGLDGSVTIYRREAGAARIIQANLRKIEAGTAEDLVLKPFDIVEVAQKGVPKRTFSPVVASGGFQTSKLVNLPLRVIE